MAGLTTYFDDCKITAIDGIDDDIIECVNFMGQIDKNVVYNKKHTVCEYHHCYIIKHRQTGRHNTVTCSGGMLRFGSDEQFFNPITPFQVDFSKMKQMPISSVELMAPGLEFYYAKDIRTTFSHDIIDINCTNNFRTCLTFNETSMCFGNVNSQTIVHSEQALVWGSMTSLVVGSFVVFVLMPRMRDNGMFYIMLMYFIPLIGIGFLYSGLILGPKIPFVMSCMLVVVLYPIVYYVLRDVHKDSSNYQKLELRKEVNDGNIKNVF